MRSARYSLTFLEGIRYEVSVKDLELTMRVRNNRLKARRLELGMSQPELAKAAGTSTNSYIRLECLKVSPKTGDGEWRKPVKAIADFFRVMPEDLFPESIEGITCPVVTRTIDGHELRALMSTDQQRRLDSASGRHDLLELTDGIGKAMGCLSERHARFVEHRYGLNGRPQLTFTEIADVEGCSMERARQIVDHSIRKLKLRKWPHRYLKDFADELP